MAKGGRGQCQKVGRTAGKRRLDGRVGRVAMSEAGGQCTVCRGGLGDRSVLSQSGCSAWAMVRGAKQSGGSVGGRASQQERSDAGRAGPRRRAGHVGRQTLVSEKQWRNLGRGWGGCGRPGWGGQRWQETNYVVKLPRADILSISRYDAD